MDRTLDLGEYTLTYNHGRSKTSLPTIFQPTAILEDFPTEDMSHS